MDTKKIVIGLLVAVAAIASIYWVSNSVFQTGLKSDVVASNKELREKLVQALKIDDLLALRNSNPIPFNEKTISTMDRGKYILKEIEINSTASRRIRIVVTVPNDITSKVPAVVAVGGHFSDLYSVYGFNTGDELAAMYKGFADVLAKSGYVTVSTMVSQHEVFEKNRTLMGERLWDLMRCVDYIRTLEQVDPQRIAVAGLSLGGEMAMWLGAMDTSIRVTVSSGFLTLMEQLKHNHCQCWNFPQLEELADFPQIYALIAPRPLLAQNGLKEPVTGFNVSIAKYAMKHIRLIYVVLGEPDNVALAVHQGGHEIDLPSLLEFLKRHL